MRTLGVAIMASLLLAGCSGSGARPAAVQPGVSSAVNEGGVEYVTNGDDFADAQTDLITPPKPGIGVTSSDDPKTALKARVREFEFSRWDKGQAKESPSRFGADRWELKIFFRKARTVSFTGTFKTVGTQVSLVPDRERKAGRYSLKDTVLVDEHTPFEKTQLRVTLVDDRKKDQIRISYRAYRGKIDVRTDQEQAPAPGSTLECQIKVLRDQSFAWVNNWTAMGFENDKPRLNGPSFFLVDIVRPSNATDAAKSCLPAQISLRGESLATSTERTGADGKVEDKLFEHDVKSDFGDVTLIGNPAQGNRRMFNLALEDKQAAKTTDAIMTVTAEDTTEDDPATAAEPEVTPPDRDAEVTPPARDDEVTPPPNGSKASRPKASRPMNSAPRITIPPAAPGDAFVSNVAGTQAARQVRDLERNRRVKGVDDFISYYRGRGRSTLQAFFTNAFPFRPMLQQISRQWDVIGWVYLTVVESPYFTGGTYKAQIRGDQRNGRFEAWGPFQFHVPAAKSAEVGMIATERVGQDERDYFAPSACGAAAYVSSQVRLYKNDSTIAILAYNQGPGGAGAAIYCSYHPDESNRRSSCTSRINNGMSGTQYQRYSRLAQNFNYTYLEMANFGVLTENMTKYVNRKLAIYFISSNPTAYGFDLRNAKRSLPTNGTVMPPNGRVNNPRCAVAIQGTI